MPIWYTHNITNIGDTDLITLFWINEPYNPEDADTYFIKVYLNNYEKTKSINSSRYKTRNY